MNWDRVIQSLERTAETQEAAVERAIATGDKQVQIAAGAAGVILYALARALREGDGR